MASAERALTISGRGGEARRRSIGGNVTQRIQRELAKLSEAPFDPQFGPAPQFVSPERPDFQTDRQVPFLSDLDAALEGIRGRKTATSAGELAGLEGLFEAADPTLRLQKAQEFINTIVGPAQGAAAIKAGFGRGPAALEATTRAGAELALPIVTEAGRQQGLARQFQVALEQARFAREESKDRAVFEGALNKVRAGISIESLNAQERQALAQFNLTAAGSESQFNLASAGLKSEQEVARSNIGLSTQQRTLALLDQLRAIRTTQTRTQPARSGVISPGAGSRTSFPPLSSAPGVTDLQRAKTNLLNQQSETLRIGNIRAGQIQPGQELPSITSLGGVLTGGGGTTTRLSTNPTGGVIKKPLTGKTTSFAKPLNLSSTFF